MTKREKLLQEIDEFAEADHNPLTFAEGGGFPEMLIFDSAILDGSGLDEVDIVDTDME